MPKRHPGRFKDFGTKSSAVAAITKAGLQNVPYTLQMNREGSTFRFEPVFTPELEEDRIYIRGEKGFNARKP